MVAMEDDGIEPQIAGFAQDLLSQYSLLRGAPLRVALRGRGRIFENSEGRAETYDLSSQVDHIDSFLSHTWGTPRWQKFMALSLHFGFPIAYASSLLVGCVISTLGALRVLCFVELESTDGLHRVPSSPFGACLCPLVFWLVLFLHSDLMPRLPGREHQIFLDKVCIHQTDAHLKQAGIAHLGMFLLFSGELVVLQADDYLERLWTVYELATFLVFHPEGRLVILPLNLPVVVLVSSAAFTMFGLVGFTFRTALVNEAVPFAAIYSSISAILIRVPFAVFAVFMMRRWATEEETRANHLQHHFSIGSARCANEDDRAPVMANIVTMLQTDDDDGTVNVFDSLVREAVPEAVRRSVGCSGLPYTDLLIIGTTLVGEGFDSIGSEIAAGSTFREAFPRCWFWFAWHFAGCPLFMATITLLARRCLQLRGFLLNVYLAVVVVIVVLVGWCVQSLLVNLRAMAASSDAVLIIDVAITLIMSLVAYFILNPRRRARGTYSTSDDASLENASRLSLQIQFARDRAASIASGTRSATPSTMGRVTLETAAHATPETPIRRVVRMTL